MNSYIPSESNVTLNGPGSVMVNPPSTPFNWVSEQTQNYVKTSIENHQHTLSVTEQVRYEFRVVEWVNDNDEIVKVGLQSRECTFSSYGYMKNDGPWTDVERVKLKL